MAGIVLPTPPASYGPKWVYQDTLRLILTEPYWEFNGTSQNPPVMQYLWHTDAPLIEEQHRWALRRVMVPAVYTNAIPTITTILSGVLNGTPTSNVTLAAGSAGIEMTSPILLDSTVGQLIVMANITTPSPAPNPFTYSSTCVIEYDDYLQQ